MDQKFQTSFIPKQEVIISDGRQGGGFRFSFFSIIAVVIFTISVILSIAVFIYQKTLVGTINSINAELVAARSSLEPSFIQELVTLDHRIESAKNLINKHNVITPIFAMLENETLRGVRFSSFSYTLDSKGQPTIELNGEAANLYSIALQSDVFNSDSKIKNPAFSSLNVEDNGVAKFNFKGSLDGQLFLYKNLITSDVIEGTTTNSGDTGSGVDITPVEGDSSGTGGSVGE